MFNYQLIPLSVFILQLHSVVKNYFQLFLPVLSTTYAMAPGWIPFCVDADAPHEPDCFDNRLKDYEFTI